MSQRRNCDNGSRGQGDVIAGFEDRMGPQAKECGWPLEDRKDKETDSPREPLEGKH